MSINPVLLSKEITEYFGLTGVQVHAMFDDKHLAWRIAVESKGNQTAIILVHEYRIRAGENDWFMQIKPALQLIFRGKSEEVTT